MDVSKQLPDFPESVTYLGCKGIPTNDFIDFDAMPVCTDYNLDDGYIASKTAEYKKNT